MLTVICGGMFAEKTTELLRLGRRYERAGKRVLYVKPAMDTRYSQGHIVTHNKDNVPAFVADNNGIGIETAGEEYDVICIDEVQFFEFDLIFEIEGLLQKGKRVIVAGLDLDYKGFPFSITAYLMAQAEEVVKLRAVCSSCGSDAWVTARHDTVDDDKRFLLGTNEYYPLCRKCYYEKIYNKGE